MVMMEEIDAIGRCPFLRCDRALCWKGGNCEGAEKPNRRKPITALRLLRRMRGASQAHFVQASDGRFYVVKFLDNPEGRRTIPNEFLGASLFGSLSINTAPPALIHFSDEFLRENPSIRIQYANQSLRVQPGVHFGSLYPGNPGETPVHDLFPRALLKTVANLGDFIGALVADTWLSNADRRQAVFYRRAKCWTLQTIDFGQILGGCNWQFTDALFKPLYIDRTVYQFMTSDGDFEPWVERVENFPERIVRSIFTLIPEEWTLGERSILEGALETLLARRSSVRGMIERLRQAPGSPFPG